MFVCYMQEKLEIATTQTAEGIHKDVSACASVIGDGKIASAHARAAPTVDQMLTIAHLNQARLIHFYVEIQKSDAFLLQIQNEVDALTVGCLQDHVTLGLTQLLIGDLSALTHTQVCLVHVSAQMTRTGIVGENALLEIGDGHP